MCIPWYCHGQGCNRTYRDPGCGILDTDLKTAFCNMVTTWCFQVPLKKGISPQVISRYRNLYEDNVSLITVNNKVGKAVQITRQSIRQGDKFAMELFSFGIDPVLEYLDRRLQGILIHSAPVQGPVLLPAPPAIQYRPPPDVPGLPPLPRPPPRPPPTLTQRYGRKLLTPLETRYTLHAYFDDLKPAITTMWEFH